MGLALAVLTVLAACSEDPLEQVRALQAKGKLEASIEPLRKLVEERPDDPEVHYRYGVALSATGQSGLALWSLEKAMESPDWRVPAGSALAAALTQMGSYDEAIDACDKVLEQKPDDATVLALRAMARIRSRSDYEAALADADRALEIDPDQVDALAAKSLALLALERVDEAGKALEALEGHFDDATQGLAGSARLCAVRASFAKEKGDLEVAEKRYDECLESFPADRVVVTEAVQFFDQRGRGDHSMEILEKALEKAPAAQSYRWALAQRLKAAGRRDEALSVLKAGTELDAPADAAEAWTGLASFYTQEEDYPEAIAAFDKALDLVPQPSPMMLFTYADTLVLAGHLDEALAVARRIEVAPFRELVQGRVALVRDHPAEALKHFTEGIRLWPDNAPSRYYSAIAAERVGDFDRAIEDYRYAVRIDPHATDAQLRLARLYAAMGEEDKALTILARSPGARMAELESELLQVRLLARLGRAKRPPPYLAQLLSQPAHWGPAVAAMARGVHDRSGAAAAAKAVRGADRLDLTDPANAAALEVLVEYLAESGKPGEGLAQVEAALRAHPDAAVLHALHGRALALDGAAAAKVRAAYERALELDADEPLALLGLARITAGEDRDAAADLCERAIAADPDDRAAVRDAAALLARLGRPEAAEQRLEDLLDEYPFDAKAALALAGLRLERGAERDRTLELARRAVRFGGGPEAKALLERVSHGAATGQAPEPKADAASS